MVFLADFTVTASEGRSPEIIKKIKELSFVLDCHPAEVLPAIGEIDPIHIRTSTQEKLFEGVLYGSYLGIKDILERTIKNIDGVTNAKVSIKRAEKLSKYSIFSALVTASVVLTAIIVSQLAIAGWDKITNGSMGTAWIPIIVSGIAGFAGSFAIETLILIKERIRREY